MAQFLLVLTTRDSAGRLQVEVNHQFGCLSIPAAPSCDLDHSYAIQLDDASAAMAAVRQQLWPYNAMQQSHPGLWKYMKGKTSVRYPRAFVAADENAVPLTRRIVELLIGVRVRLGDEGHWWIWTCRELHLAREGCALSHLAQKELRSSSLTTQAVNCRQSDYSDELESFRFPSISCLYGNSQPLAALGGVINFQKLFVRDGTGVYVVFDKDVVLYVGMSQYLSRRLSNTGSHHKLRFIFERFPRARVALLHYPFWKLKALEEAVTDAEEEAAQEQLRELFFGLERACIEHYRPRYNGKSEEQLSEQPLSVH